MADLLHRVGGWVRPPGRRQLGVFASLTAATQGEAVFSFLGTAALVRLAGTETSGNVFFAQSLASVWFMLWDPKLDDAAQRFIPLHQSSAAGRGTWLFLRLFRLDALINLSVAVFGALAVMVARSAGWISGDQAMFLALAAVRGGLAAADGTARAGFAVSGRLGLLGGMRLATAALSFTLAVSALVVGGPGAYLTALAITTLASTAVLSFTGWRLVVRVFGPPPTGPVPVPDGIARFALKSSAAASVSAGSDSSVLVLAGLLGGPALVTYLKVAAAPGRLLTSFVSAVAAQLYPRLTATVAAREGAVTERAALLQRDILRASTLLAAFGVVTVTIALPLAGPLLALAYGPSYAALATLALILLVAAGIRGVIIWSKVLPLALGRPGLRLAFVAGDGAALILVLLAATGLSDRPGQIALIFGWGSVVVAAVGAVAWLALLRPLVVRS